MVAATFATSTCLGRGSPCGLPGGLPGSTVPRFHGSTARIAVKAMLHWLEDLDGTFFEVGMKR